MSVSFTAEEEQRISWFPKYGELRFEDVVSQAKDRAHKSAYDLIKTLLAKSTEKTPLQVATAESLTGGYMFSTLVDVPQGGKVKYGCFSVYDTDAKRIFLGVEIKDVYTHRCAQEMAVGVLKNSNATFAVAVTGNAMPWQGQGSENEIRKLGEVFIGIAGYGSNNTIVVETHAYNFCNGNEAAQTCKIWYQTVTRENSLAQMKAVPVTEEFKKSLDGYNEYIVTSQVAAYIRAETTTW